MTTNLNRGFHLTYEDRIYIESSLNENVPFNEIARVLKKHPTTISREIRRHMLTVSPRAFNNEYISNKCVHRYSCHFTNVCYPMN